MHTLHSSLVVSAVLLMVTTALIVVAGRRFGSASNPRGRRVLQASVGAGAAAAVVLVAASSGVTSASSASTHPVVTGLPSLHTASLASFVRAAQPASQVPASKFAAKTHGRHGSLSPWPANSYVSSAGNGWKRVDMRMTGDKSHIYGAMTLLLPPNWTPNPAKPYPLLEVLPGFPGAPLVMLAQGRLNDSIQVATRTHVLAQPVVIFPQDHALRDTECINSQLGNWATWLGVDVPNWAMANLGVSADAQAHATLGFSMGAYCSSMLAVKYPNTFAASISFGGYTAPAFQAPDPIFRTPAMMQQYDIANILYTTPPRISMWMQTDPLDRISYPATSRFLAQLVPAPTRITVYVTPRQGHSMHIMQKLAPVSLAWLAQTLPAFKG